MVGSVIPDEAAILACTKSGGKAHLDMVRHAKRHTWWLAHPRLKVLIVGLAEAPPGSFDGMHSNRLIAQLRLGCLTQTKSPRVLFGSRARVSIVELSFKPDCDGFVTVFPATACKC
jgi:hypothetical protein